MTELFEGLGFAAEIGAGWVGRSPCTAIFSLTKFISGKIVLKLKLT